MSTGATTTWNIPLFGDSDFVTPIQTPLNAQSNALDTALTSLVTKAGRLGPFNTLAILQLPANAGTLVGQQATVNADSTAANNGEYRWSGTQWVQIEIFGAPASLFTPYATAAGSGTNTAGNYTTITFPAGRFTQPPLVFGKSKGAQPAIFNTNTITATTAQCAGFVGTNAVASSWDWFAVQMLPTAAAG